MGVDIKDDSDGGQGHKLKFKGVHINFQFKIPEYLDSRIGTDVIQRGRWPTGPNTGKSAAKKHEKNYALVFWDHLLVCKEVENCPLRPCTYSEVCSRSGFRRPNKWCLVQKIYLKSIIAAGLQYIERTGNDFDKILILGFHLLPLYNILFKHKLEMLRLNGFSRDPEYPENVHPIFAEFRATLDSIDTVWNRLGQKRKGGFVSAAPNLKEAYMNRLMGKQSRRTRKPKPKSAEQGTGIKF